MIAKRIDRDRFRTLLCLHVERVVWAHKHKREHQLLEMKMQILKEKHLREVERELKKNKEN